MIVFRGLCFTLIALALMLLGADVVSSLESHTGAVIRSFDKVLLLLAMNPKPWLHLHAAPQVANVCLAILALPGWVVLGAPGVLLALVLPNPGRKRTKAPPPQEPIHR